MGYAPGAFEWFSDCVLNYGPENVCVVSFVQSRCLRELLASFLFVQDGLLHAADIPRASLAWANSRSGKTQALCPE